MGRETEAEVRYGPEAGHARALLESDALILRGTIRARIPRDALLAPRVNADTLHITAPSGPLTLTMPAGEAAKWLRALEKPLPSLAEKLGLTGQTVWCLTPIEDEDLKNATASATRASGPDATLAIAVLLGAPDLAQLIDTATTYPALTIWAVNRKGPNAPLPEAAIRTALRDAGLIDSKSCAVSATLSATRYARRKG